MSARLSVIVPLHNERATAGAVLDALLALELPGLEREIIVVESGSTDGTRELAAAYAARPQVAVLHEPEARGKGAAAREGLRRATGDFILIQDGDLEYSVADYPAVLAPLLAGEADLVLGVRPPAGPLFWRFARRAATALFNARHGTSFSDGATMFKAFRAELLRALPFTGDGFDYDWELLAGAVRRKARIRELPVSYAPRSRAEGKKVSAWRDGPRVVAAILRA